MNIKKPGMRATLTMAETPTESSSIVEFDHIRIEIHGFDTSFVLKKEGREVHRQKIDYVGPMPLLSGSNGFIDLCGFKATTTKVRP